MKTVARPKLGTKRDCPSCGARFYDLEKEPCTCPKCEHEFVPEPLLKSKQRVPEPQEPKKETPEEEETTEAPEVEEVTEEKLTTFSEDDDEDSDGDEDDALIAGIEDVDEESESEEDDTLIDLDEDEDDVGIMIDPNIAKDE